VTPKRLYHTAKSNNMGSIIQKIIDMKQFYIILVAMFVMKGAMAQWVPQNSGTIHNLRSVFFTDVNTGYAVGDSGTILKTTNGGSNWEMKSSGVTSNLYSVQFTDFLTGYAVGDSSIILKTIDGGENWINQPISISVDLSSISFPATDTGYVLGFFYDWTINDTLYTYILKTSNGGNLWTISYLYKTIDDVGSPYLNSVFFPDVNTGYAVGVTGSMLYYPYLVKTTDGGMQWTNQTLSNFSNVGLLSAHFLNPDTGYVTGYGEYNSLKTINGGNDWTALTSNDFAVHYSVYFIDSEQGYLVGGLSWSNGNIIQYTKDGGNNWTNQYIDNISGNYLLSVNFANDSTGYAVGSDGTILKTTNGGGYPVGINDHHQTVNTLTIYPNPAFTNITIETPTKGFLSIINISGQQLLKQTITEPKTTIDVSGFKSGVYFVRLTGERAVQVGKFIKQ
jgi:photosystem II stability/assembly factor-like uncharacterized protein